VVAVAVRIEEITSVFFVVRLGVSQGLKEA
jgi:hypothetical protein